MPITPQELIANLGDLPPLPQVAAQVLLWERFLAC